MADEFGKRPIIYEPGSIAASQAEVALLFRNSHYERFLPVRTIRDVLELNVQSVLQEYETFVSERAGTLTYVTVRALTL